MRLHCTVGLLVCGLIALTPRIEAAKPPGNLLVNGSFEEGPEDIGDFLSLEEGSAKIKGWVVIKGQIDVVGTYWQSAHKKRSIDLHGTPGYGGVAQTFKTEKGKKYKVTFFLAGNPGGTVHKKKMAVRAAGQEREFTFDTKGKTTTDMGWVQHTWEFTAEKSETTLELYTLMTEDESCGPAIDDVSVVAVE